MDILFKQEEIQKLVAYANEIPTKYGAPILSFINEVKGLRTKEVEAEAKSPEAKVPARASEPVLE